MANRAYVVSKNSPSPYTNVTTTQSGGRVYQPRPRSSSPSYNIGQTAGQAAASSRQRMSQELWGGSSGVGSMQPGHVVSVERKPSPQQQQAQQAREQNQQLIQNLVGSMQSAREQANEANLQRYQDLMATIGDLQANVLGEEGTYAEAMGLMQGTGESARRRVARQRTQEHGRAEQDLISRGLGNTTVRESVRRGIGRQAEEQMQQIDEQVAQRLAGLLRERAGMETQLGQLKARAIQQRTDQGPDVGQYMQLLSQLASV
mgnify:CR=1 FL=1